MSIPPNQEKMIKRLIRKTNEHIDLLYKMLELNNSGDSVSSAAVDINDTMRLFLSGIDRKKGVISVGKPGQGWVDVVYNDDGLELHVFDDRGDPVAPPMVFKKADLGE